MASLNKVMAIAVAPGRKPLLYRHSRRKYGLWLPMSGVEVVTVGQVFVEFLLHWK